MSRASFYTYFPSKREALLALGAQAVDGADAMLRELQSLPRDPTTDDLVVFVRHYFGTLDEIGSFSLALGQASHHDAELRTLGVKAHRRLSRAIGRGPRRAPRQTVREARGAGLPPRVPDGAGVGAVPAARRPGSDRRRPARDRREPVGRAGDPLRSRRAARCSVPVTAGPGGRYLTLLSSRNTVAGSGGRDRRPGGCGLRGGPTVTPPWSPASSSCAGHRRA